jgi:hypothetical protein
VATWEKGDADSKGVYRGVINDGPEKFECGCIGIITILRVLFVMEGARSIRCLRHVFLPRRYSPDLRNDTMLVRVRVKISAIIRWTKVPSVPLRNRR